MRYRLPPAVFIFSLLAASSAYPDNPCIDVYPSMAGEILRSNGGRVESIAPVEWLEEGVYRITVESGGQFMTRPGKLPIPVIGSRLEYRIFSRDANSAPLAACYCQIGTDICVEEYAFQ